MSTEARHAAWVASAIHLENPWSGAYDVRTDPSFPIPSYSPHTQTALTFNEVYSLASAFIVSCPESNPTLPFKAFPTLTLGDGKPGDYVSVTYANGTDTNGDMYVAFFSGLDKTFVQVTDGQVTIPGDLKGTVYAVATNNATAATDDTTIAGPAILAFPYGPDGNLLD